jgi:hypothetical protein
MQSSNSCFHPYLSSSGKYSETNPPSFDETTAQAFLTLAEAAKLLKDKNPGEYKKIESSIFQTVGQLNNQIKQKIGTYKTLGKMKIPGWLISDRGDISSIFLMGLSQFYSVTPIPAVSEVSSNLAEGIIQFKCASPEDFPRFAHLSFADTPFIWKTSTAFQVASLARGGKIFSKNSWVQEAESESVGFLVHFPASYGPIEGYFPHPDIHTQTPAAAYALTANFSALARTTGDIKYSKIAGLCAAWFLRNNITGKPLYNSSDGSCFKEISSDRISDEKSLIGSAYAVLSLLEVHGTKAQNYLSYHPIKRHTFMVFESETGKPVHNDFEVTDWNYPHGRQGKVVIIRRLNTFWHRLEVANQDEYFLLMSFQKQKYFSSAVAVNVRVDGGPILLAPLGGAEQDPYMVMQKVTDPVEMTPGPHTIGVRYKGLLYTQPAIIDCIVVQPTLEFVHLVNNNNNHLVLMKNWKTDKKRNSMPSEFTGVNPSADCKGIDGSKTSNPYELHKGKKYFVMPREGFGMFEW